MILKKVFMMIIGAIFLLNGVTAVSDLQIVVDEITPLPVEPGEDMTIKIRLENVGDSSAEDVIVERVYDFPFRLEYQLQEEVVIGTLSPSNSRELTFYISVSPKAKTGVYPLTFKIKEGISVKEQEILINVVGNPDVVFNVNSLSNNIIPNEVFTANVELLNIGTGNARNIKISSDYENFAFEDSSLILVENLESGMSTNITFNVIVDKSIEAGLYQIPISFEMIGENGQTYTSSQKLNVKVVNKAEVSMKDLKIKPAGVIVGKPVTVEVRTENIGVGAAENVYVELKFEDGVQITGNKKAYIGHLDRTDESPAFFTLNSKISGKFPAKVLIHYTDDLGKHVSEESLNITYKEDTSTNYTLYGVLALAFIVIVVIAMKHKK